MGRPTRAERVEIAQRRKQAIAYRRAGVPWAEIAERLGYADAGAACKDVSRALEQSNAGLAEEVTLLRRVELDRLDRLQAAVWTKAITGDLKAVETVLKISARRADLVPGMRAPQEHTVITMDSVEREMARLHEQIEEAERLKAARALDHDDDGAVSAG
jgi:DNA-binding transcriptional MerR regulator